MRLRFTLAVAVCVTVAAEAVSPQAGSVGADIVHIRFSALGEEPVGAGIRATIGTRNNSASLDAEFSVYPSNPSGNFGERLWLLGGRFRLPVSRHDILARARVGHVFFTGSFFDDRLTDRSRTAFDIGLTFEWHPSKRVLARVDTGDLIVPFNGATYQGGGPAPSVLGTTHNFVIGAGLAWRF